MQESHTAPALSRLCVIFFKQISLWTNIFFYLLSLFETQNVFCLNFFYSHFWTEFFFTLDFLDLILCDIFWAFFTLNLNTTTITIQYQPSGEGATRSPPATMHRLHRRTACTAAPHATRHRHFPRDPWMFGGRGTYPAPYAMHIYRVSTITLDTLFFAIYRLPKHLQ